MLGIFTGKCVGIIGGFGAYATLDFYGRLLDSFAVESERDYPNMIIDNVFSMPSRTRALLTGEGQTEIVETIANSMKKMLDYDVDCMVMICGTAHYFLPYVHEKLPEGFQRAEYLLEHGMVDMVVDRAHMKEELVKVLSVLTANIKK